MDQNKSFLKDRFLEAVLQGELGLVTDRGIEFTLKEFKAVFSDITSDYVNSFLPAATIEAGRVEMSHTKFLFRLRKGVYLLHPDALEICVD